ncbi:hypothetical protein HCN50_17330 [Bradyrhizobium sp. WSM 1744]|uniref:Hap4 transcription factor heteromerisation domain-containing protein n=1 Tax=Bradyrhizobium archetypum TaxID=2721160 RepID=A0A7Y4M3F7_9BRAD|nr:hypothetical protein [Bradyrhizobium archetypum]
MHGRRHVLPARCRPGRK